MNLRLQKLKRPEMETLSRFSLIYKRDLRPGSKVKLIKGSKSNKKSYIIKGHSKKGYILLNNYYGLNSAKMLYHIKVHPSNVTKEK